jgi:leucyl aminopeptidase (aminopeptidase T)
MLELSRGARNAVEVCMGVGRDEKVLILTDTERQHIGHAIAEECELREGRVHLLKIEDFIQRPALHLPEALTERVDEIAPDVSFYVATAKEGELQGFRGPYMKHIIYELKVRHGHMIGIDDRCMAEGMAADYEEIARLTGRVHEILKEARLVEAQAPSGTDMRATLDPSRLRWHPCPGIYRDPGQWGNLPEGETFTSPASLDGVLGGEVLGDHFSEKYGLLETPMRLEVAAGRVRKVSHPDDGIRSEMEKYLAQHENSNRAGEFAIGTNVALKEPVGNMLQDEKIPGVHVAFGHPYPEETGADWDCPSHCDVIATRSTIKVDGQYLMRDGEFVI